MESLIWFACLAIDRARVFYCTAWKSASDRRCLLYISASAGDLPCDLVSEPPSQPDPTRSPVPTRPNPTRLHTHVPLEWCFGVAHTRKRLCGAGGVWCAVEPLLPPTRGPPHLEDSTRLESPDHRRRCRPNALGRDVATRAQLFPMSTHSNRENTPCLRVPFLVVQLLSKECSIANSVCVCVVISSSLTLSSHSPFALPLAIPLTQ